MPRLTNQIVSEKERVLEMHNVWSMRKQEFMKMDTIYVLITRGHIEKVEMRGLGEKEVLACISVDHAKRCSRMSAVRNGDIGTETGEENWLKFVRNAHSPVQF